MNKKLKWYHILIILVLAVAGAAVLSISKLDYTYHLRDESGDNYELRYESYILDDEQTQFDYDSGEYIPLNIDPWIMYEGINGEYDGVLIRIAVAPPDNMRNQIYWTCDENEEMSEDYVTDFTINQGTKIAYVDLPKYAIKDIRFDFSEICKIESILLVKDGVYKTYSISKAFVKAWVIRAAILLIILLLAAFAHIERVGRQGRPIAGLFADAPNEGRRYELDYIRAIAAFLVIMMHSRGSGESTALSIILAISLVCNCLYTMLSGALLLGPRDESIGDFYRKRLPRVLIPAISYYLLYAIQGYSQEIFVDGIVPGLKNIGLGLITGRPAMMPHMWFIYVILGLYVLAPFLRIMVQQLSTAQLFGLIVAGFVFDCLATGFIIKGIEIGIDTPVASWMGIFLLGYYMTTEHAAKRYPLFMALGALGLAATCICVLKFPQFLYYESNWTPFMWLEGAGIFAVFIYFKKVFGRRNVLVASIAKYNFSIMLVHVLLLVKIINPFAWRIINEYGHMHLVIIVVMFACLALSWLASVVFDNTVIAAVNYVYAKVSGGLKRS